jgi:hypothetical protein
MTASCREMSQQRPVFPCVVATIPVFVRRTRPPLLHASLRLSAPASGTPSGIPDSGRKTLHRGPVYPTLNKRSFSHPLCAAGVLGVRYMHAQGPPRGEGERGDGDSVCACLCERVGREGKCVYDVWVLSMGSWDKR